jgi:hypothetical protein
MKGYKNTNTTSANTIKRKGDRKDPQKSGRDAHDEGKNKGDKNTKSELNTVQNVIIMGKKIRIWYVLR